MVLHSVTPQMNPWVGQNSAMNMNNNEQQQGWLFLRTSGRCNRQSEFTLLHFTIFH